MTKYPKGSYIRKGSNRRKVLEELGELRFVSVDFGDHSETSFYATVDELERLGWKEEEEWPKEGDKYWCIQGIGRLKEFIWYADDSTDRPIRDFMGVFRTRKEAEERMEKIKGFVKTLK